LEQLFCECVEQVRKEIIKQRLKMKKEHLNEESKEFEESLMRLVEFSRHGVP
jgi:hypothetical protein